MFLSYPKYRYWGKTNILPCTTIVVRFLFFCLIGNTLGQVSAQPRIKFEHFSQEDGLSAEGVQCIVQDHQGFMWFGTGGGLDKFDGYRFTSYRHDLEDSSSISSNFIKTLFVDRQGVLWVGTAGGGLNRYDPLTEQFFRYRHDPEKPGSLNDDDILSIYEDREGVLWIGTNNGGLNRLEPGKEQFTSYSHQPGNPNSLQGNQVYAIIEDRQKVLWVGTDKGLNRFDRDREQFVFFSFDGDPSFSQLKPSSIKSIYEDRTGVLWIGTSGNGLKRFDRQTGRFKTYKHEPGNPNSLSTNWVNAICEDRRNQLWIGVGQGGICRFDPKSDHFIPFHHYPHDPNSLNSDIVYAIYEDLQGGIWVGTENGLNRFDQQSMQFQYYIHDPANPNSLSGDRISSVYEDKAGDVWIGTVGTGLNRFDRTTGKFVRYRYNPEYPYSLGSDYINSNCIQEDAQNGLWIGTRSGMNYFDDQENRFFHYKYDPPDSTPITFNHNLIQFVYKDRQNIFWIGTRQGLYRFHPETKQFHAYLHDPSDPNSLTSNYILAITEDKNGMLWVGTNKGLNRFDRESGKFFHYLRDPADPRSISSDVIQMIHEDRQGVLWISTLNGLNRCDDREKGQFTYYLEKDGLASNSLLLGIQEDGQGNLWLSTSRGLTKFVPSEERFYNYDKRDGLINNTVYSLHKSAKTGEIFINGEGLTIFHPDSIRENPYVPPIVFTNLNYYQKGEREGKSIAVRGVTEKRHLSFNYNDRVISLEFSALNYHNTHKNKYAYQLVPGTRDFEDWNKKNWVQLGTENRVTFSSLSPGAYTLWVKGSNDNGVWSDKFASLRFTITPPWWQTNLAYIFYVLMAFVSLYGLYRFQLKRRLEQAETLRLMELDAVKTKLYTNITHEFRTPLTVIQGMSDQILDKPREIQEQSIRMIKRNGTQLLHLVNQMLDLRKLESGKVPVNLIQGDIVQYLRYIQESFHSLAESMKIRLHFLSNAESLFVDFDPDKLLHIISNLLSNALKYTSEEGDVYLSLRFNDASGDKQTLEISVKDNGAGIPAKTLPFIFDRFYQADPQNDQIGSSSELASLHTNGSPRGTGIGLALTKEFVKLLNGEISVKSTLGKGSEFIVLLPVQNQAERQENLIEGKRPASQISPLIPNPSAIVATKVPVSTKKDQSLVLIIEDNPDVTNYLISCLDGAYRLITAINGQEGIDKAIAQVPDMIISDVMMPKKNGFEVCGILKLDERTSHIPIILLTAKADQASKIEGLKRGADVYLSKPFNKEELLVHTKKLIQLRKRLWERYQSLNPIPSSTDKAFQLEDAFLQKLQAIIEENISEPDFGIVHLCQAIGRSRAQLFRKIKALTGKSPSLFIRAIRLQKARELLLTTDLNITEIAFEVGFKDLSYFSRTFTEEFGLSPSATRK